MYTARATASQAAPGDAASQDANTTANITAAMPEKNPSLKKIPVAQLRLGMFLNELCGSWMDHPFWNTRFKIDNPADLAALRASAVSHVWIDTARGLDVVPEHAEPAGESVAEHQSRVEHELQVLARACTPQDQRIDMAGELARAAAICARSRQAVTAMFSEARMGRAIDIERLDPLVEDIADSVQRNPGALISLARLKNQDDYTYMHSVAVCGLMIALARRLGLDETSVREAGLAGMVHDVGKARVSLDILNKPGKLTDEEFKHMKSHPVRVMPAARERHGRPHSLDVCLHRRKSTAVGIPNG